MYRLEILEERLTTTQTGREIVDVFRLHVEEVMLLINHNRQVMVVWHRNHGPEFIGSAVRSGYDKGFKVLQEVEGVSLPQLIRRMAAILQDSGTPSLKKVIGDNFVMVLSWAQRFTSLNEVLDEIENIDSQQR